MHQHRRGWTGRTTAAVHVLALAAGVAGCASPPPRPAPPPSEFAVRPSPAGPRKVGPAEESERILRLYEETTLPAARENVKLTQAEYTVGRVPFLNLIEAQRNLVELRDRYYEVTAEAVRRRAALERAVGTPPVLPTPAPAAATPPKAKEPEYPKPTPPARRDSPVLPSPGGKRPGPSGP